MYNSYFGFREAPFNVTPDPNFFYTNPIYQEAFATLLYGIKAKKGFMVITGEVGTGKTTLLRKLMRNLEATIHSVFIFNTQVTFPQLLQLILHDLGLSNKEKNKLMMIQQLNEYLIQQLKKGHTVALLIDEAQNLSDEALEGLRLLSNLETDKEKLLQIMLMGQPELDAKLNRASLRQLKQRIAIRSRLDSLAHREIGNYIIHRLQVAVYKGSELFSKEAIERIWDYSRGSPRLINIICDNALLLAYATNGHLVSRTMIEEVAHDLRLEPELKLAKPDDTEFKIPNILFPTEMIESDNGKENNTKAPATTTAFTGNNRHGASLPGVVSPNFIARMTTALTEAMGPMAPMVVRHEIAILGESPDTFTTPRLTELVELVSRKILNEAMKIEFQKTMFEEMRPLTTLKTGSRRVAK